MHSPEYTKKIKSVLASREELTLNLNSAVYQFRNGRSPYAENLEQAKQSFAELMAILDPQENEKKEEA